MGPSVLREVESTLNRRLARWICKISEFKSYKVTMLSHINIFLLFISSFQQQPISVSRDDDVTVRFWRCNNGKKVWYEWAVTEPSCSAIHNPAGRSYTIGL